MSVIYWDRRESTLDSGTRLEVWTASDVTRFGTGASLTVDRTNGVGAYAWTIRHASWWWSGSAATFNAAESRMLDVLADNFASLSGGAS